MPLSTLSFGIEIELLVAYLDPLQLRPSPHETRTAHFPKAPNDDPILSITEIGDIQHSIRQTLLSSGVNVIPTPPHPTVENYRHSPDVSFGKWEVSDDPSIHSPPLTKNGYKMYGIEIKSPAFFFNPNALKEVGYVMGVLTSKYICALNSTTGLHVHVGNGVQSFNFDEIRKLMAFLWAFEPQMNSLHPQSRFNCGWAGSLRYASTMAEQFLRGWGRRMRPLEGVTMLLQVQDWDNLREECRASGYHRISKLAYRWGDLARIERQKQSWGSHDPDLKMTVEFRQHEGSLDGEAIQMWVRTVVGIVAFVMDSDAMALRDLFANIEHETFDDNEGKTAEPVLAETDFTIIDLLRHMNLNIPAAYYRKRGLYQIRYKAFEESVRAEPTRSFGSFADSSAGHPNTPPPAGCAKVGPSNSDNNERAEQQTGHFLISPSNNCFNGSSNHHSSDQEAAADAKNSTEAEDQEENALDTLYRPPSNPSSPTLSSSNLSTAGASIHVEFVPRLKRKIPDENGVVRPSIFHTDDMQSVSLNEDAV